MPMSGYLQEVRRKVGHDLLVLPSAAVVLHDEQMRILLCLHADKQIWVTPDQVEYILPKGREMVTMVSCIGDKIIQEGEVVDESHRLITIAEPA